MKKFIASITFILLFTGFALFQNGAANAQSIIPATSGSSGASTPIAKRTATTATTVPPPKKTVASASGAPRGQYRDGTYTGSPAGAYYGNVQVQVTVRNGRITNVVFLSYPQDRSTSRSINANAMSQLAQEAISAQSANVSGVSGATDTSAAFQQSLSSALQQAA